MVKQTQIIGWQTAAWTVWVCLTILWGWRLKVDHINLFQPSVAFYIETSHLFFFVKQITGFYIECNTGLKCVNKLHALVTVNPENINENNHRIILTVKEKIDKCKGNTKQNKPITTGESPLKSYHSQKEKQLSIIHVAFFKFDKVIIPLLERCNNKSTSWN